MPLDVGRRTHLLEQMHRSEDDSGDPIDADKVLVTDGARGFTWEDYGASGVDVPVDHGSMGAAETFDIAAGTWHRGTLDDDCTFTITGFPIDEGVVALLEITQDGTGGHAITWDADVDFGGGDDQPNQAIDGYTAYVLWSSEGDSQIYGAKVGSGSALTVEDEGSGIESATVVIDFTGAGVTVTSTASGQVEVAIPGGGDPSADTQVWMPLTTVVGGEPELVWDGDDSLIPTLVPV